MANQNQKPQEQAQESNKPNGDWYAESSEHQRIELLKHAGWLRGWKVVSSDSVEFLGHVAKFAAVGYRYLEVFKNGELVFDADWRGFSPVDIAGRLSVIERRIKERLPMHEYEVSLSRDTAEQITIKVSAHTEAEARDIALGEAQSNHDLDWNQTDYIGDVQADSVTLASEVKED